MHCETTQLLIAVTARQVGATSPRREELVEIVKQYEMEHPTVAIHADPGRLGYNEWQDLLLSSRFTLTPGGHNPETFRMFEALETGCVRRCGNSQEHVCLTISRL